MRASQCTWASNLRTYSSLSGCAPSASGPLCCSSDCLSLARFATRSLSIPFSIPSRQDLFSNSERTTGVLASAPKTQQIITMPNANALNRKRIRTSLIVQLGWLMNRGIEALRRDMWLGASGLPRSAPSAGGNDPSTRVNPTRQETAAAHPLPGAFPDAGIQFGLRCNAWRFLQSANPGPPTTRETDRYHNGPAFLRYSARNDSNVSQTSSTSNDLLHAS